MTAKKVSRSWSRAGGRRCGGTSLRNATRKRTYAAATVAFCATIVERTNARRPQRSTNDPTVPEKTIAAPVVKKPNIEGSNVVRGYN